MDETTTTTDTQGGRKKFRHPNQGPVLLNAVQTCRLLGVSRKMLGNLLSHNLLTNTSPYASQTGVGGRPGKGGFAINLDEATALKAKLVRGEVNLGAFRKKIGGWKRPDITARHLAGGKEAAARLQALDDKLSALLARLGGPGAPGGTEGV